MTGFLVSSPGWPGTLHLPTSVSMLGFTGMCHHDGLGFEYLFLTVREIKIGSFCDTPQQTFSFYNLTFLTKIHS